MSSIEAAAGSALLSKMLTRLEELIKPDRVQKVQAVSKPFRIGKTILDRATTTATTPPDTPDIEIANPLDQDMRITAITIIPDDTFKTNARCKLQVEDVTVLEIESAGDATDLNNLPLTIPNEGWKIKPKETIKLFMWASSGTIAATLVVHFQRD